MAYFCNQCGTSFAGAPAFCSACGASTHSKVPFSSYSADVDYCSESSLDDATSRLTMSSVVFWGSVLVDSIFLATNGELAAIFSKWSGILGYVATLSALVFVWVRVCQFKSWARTTVTALYGFFSVLSLVVFMTLISSKPDVAIVNLIEAVMRITALSMLFTRPLTGRFR